MESRVEGIRYGVGECSLGAIVVAATDHGVCAILPGDDAGAAVRDLRDRFPEARPTDDDAALAPVVAAVVALFEAPARGFDLPLDLRGTPFQQRVWTALREIPVGSTASYSAIAARVGAPTEALAVADACAANPVAVAVPCHRVVRKDGTLSGYRWGVRRKRALLAREASLRVEGQL